MPRNIWIRIGILFLFLAVAFALYVTIAPRVEPLPVYMALPQVNLTDQDGQSFSLSQTRGKVVLLSLVYTHCPDICPLTTANVKQIQDRLKSAGLSAQVELVTFTVDPQRDTPTVLKSFAEVYGWDPSNWVFLTGAADQIQVLINTLGLYVERVYYIGGTPYPETTLPNPPPDTPYLVNHTDRMFLIDRQGNVRALVPGSSTNVEDDLRMIQELLREPDKG